MPGLTIPHRLWLRCLLTLVGLSACESRPPLGAGTGNPNAGDRGAFEILVHRELVHATCSMTSSCPASAVEHPDAPLRELSPAQRVVRAQVDAYNRHDLDAFAATYAADIAFYFFPETTAVARGQGALRAQYGQLFINTPNIHVSIGRERVMGNFVLLEELLSGTPAGDTTKHIVIYEVRHDKIARVWFLP